MPCAKSNPALALVEPRLDLDLAFGHEVHRMRGLAAANDDFIPVHLPGAQQLRDVSNIPGGEMSEQWNAGYHAPCYNEITTMDHFRKCSCDDTNRKRYHD